ncbi:MAG TPA: protein kinase [Pyrinomonadaceae bacterium]|jgi:serine/threonine protein kinase/tetratricopeptide (TPR) repeat protein
MNPQKWRQIEDIFQAALDLPADERARFIAEKCGADEQLRREVERLVARGEQEETFLESPVWTDSRFMQTNVMRGIADSLDEEISPSGEPKSLIGERVGAYRLIEELGRGGMGVVYLAERADGEFRQKAAVKLIKRGMDTDFIVRRFRRERQIVATLNHPNIARLLDGGTTDEGAPYFVMEFIEGEPLLKYCADFDTRRKIEVFLQICAAIHYAHERKIIHRDVKPSNVLVTADGTPKLLDFGIAKLLDGESIHESFMPTATAMRLMTPEYASPEQVRGEAVTSASDQYSLGVLFYELITGKRPYKFPSRAPHEIARVICEELPEEPISGDFDETPVGENDLQADAEACRKLDRIVLKTLRKVPAERYASVADFAADLERFLRGETVRAESFTGENAKSAESDAPASPATAAKSIAVLPLKNLNARSDENTGGADFLGIGLADALISRLSNIRRFLVRPTSSVLRFDAADADSFAAGAELSVNFVLDGSFLKTERRIRVSLQLLDVAAKSTVWAERFDEDLTDVLTLEDRISQRVADALVPQLSTGEVQILAKRPTDDAEAYEAYLRGRFHWNSFTEDGLREAIVYYRRAIEIDPDFALAYAGIADYYIWLGVYGVLPTAEFYPPARDAAMRALALDPDLSEARAALGLATLYGEYDWAASEKDLRRAVELNPNNSVAHLWFSHVLYSQKRFAEGTRHLEKALALDPFSFQHHNTRAWSFYFSRRFDEALAHSARLVLQFPESNQAYFSRVCFLNYAGQTAEATEVMRRGAALSNDPLFTNYGFAQIAAAAGDRRTAEELIEKTHRETDREFSNFYIALIYSFLKDKDAAFDRLERAFAERESLLVWLDVEPSLDVLRDDERYFALLVRMNHPLALRAAQIERAAEKRVAGVREDSGAAESVKAVRKGERTGATRRAGIKRGAFLVIASIVLLPVFAALTIATEISPAVMLAGFIVTFCGGLLRIIYALFFEPPVSPNESEKS